MENEKINTKDFFKVIKKTILFIFNIDKKRSFKILLITLFSSILSITISYLFSQFLNSAVYSETKNIFSEKNIFFIILIIGFGILSSVLSYFYLIIYHKFSRNLFTQANLRVSEASSRIDIQTYESPGFELRKTRVNMYFDKIQQFADSSIEMLEAFLPVIISTVVIAYSNKPILLVFLVIPALINFYVEVIDGQDLWNVENNATEERKKFSSLSSFFRSKNYIEEIKIHGLSSFLLKNIKSSREKINSLYDKRDIRYSKKKLASNIFSEFLEITVPVFLIYQVFSGQLLVGTFWFLNGRFDSFNNNFRRTLRIFSRMYKSAPYVVDIFKYIETKEVLPNGKSIINSFESLEIKDLSFSYPESDINVLKNINLKINKGEKIAIIGLNGAGKTTLTKLILRFYFPTSGDVLYNGFSIKDIKKETLYENIGFLPQDFAKFDLTFEDAIALASSHKDFEKVQESAKNAGIHDFIMSHKNGYKTQIGKKYKDGVELSGGQWQKLAVSRLFYRNADLWILDEPTSAIDAEAESQIFEQLEKLPDDKTVIMISHRFSTVRNADKICVIKDGRVHEYGTHDELIQNADEYARLFNLQAEGYK